MIVLRKAKSSSDLARRGAPRKLSVYSNAAILIPWISNIHSMLYQSRYQDIRIESTVLKPIIIVILTESKTQWVSSFCRAYLRE